MKFHITAQPTGTNVVSLADMKEFLRVDHTDDDTTITAIIDAAVQSVQDYTGRHFKLTTYTLSLDSFQNVEIPSQIISVTAVNYYNSANVSTTLDTSKYYYDNLREPARIAFIDPPDTFKDRFNSVVITGSFGENTPVAPIKHAIKMLAAHYYENRRAVIVGVTSTKIPLGIEAMLNPYRIISLT